MNNIDVKIKKLNDKAVIPTYGSEYAAGADLYACLDKEITIKPGETVFIGTGLAFEIPQETVMLIFARSGLGCKKGLAPSNKVAVIDCDYRGEVMIALHNHSKEEHTIAPNDRIAQMVITPYYKASFEQVEELSDTSRGAGGFGSTGANINK